jgi:hypothetical protein
MPLLTFRAIEACKPKDHPYKMTLDRGLQLRIAPDGNRTLLVRYTVKGSNSERQYRLAQDYGDRPGQIKLADARAEAARIRALARDGVDWPEQEAAEREDGLTVATALREYVEKKRRAKDGLSLKARTKADYLAMVDPGRISAKEKQFADGALYPLADKLLAKLTANDIRGVYETQRKRSERQAVYAMQVLRALFALARCPDRRQPARARYRRPRPNRVCADHGRSVSDSARTSWGVVAGSNCCAVAGGGRLLQVSIADRVPWHRNSWQQASRLSAHSGQGRRSFRGQDCAA